MNDGGWIKLHRKMLDWGWYTDTVTKCVFLHLLLLANYGEREFLGHTIHAGQAVVTYGKLAADLGLTVQNVRTAIEKLERTHEINRQVTSNFQLITIEKWALYQLDAGGGNNEVTSNQQGSNNLVTSDQQHYKKDKNEKNYYSYGNEQKIPTQDEVNERLARMRAQIRKANELL